MKILYIKGFNKDGQESFSYRTVYLNTSKLHENAQPLKRDNYIKTSKVKTLIVIYLKL